MEPRPEVKRFLDAQALAHATSEESRKASEGNRQSYEKFYQNLALFSSGTIALSVTFLGYLKSSGAITTHKPFLIVAWSCLLMTLALSLFANFFYSHYVHYSWQRQVRECDSSKFEAELQAFQYMVYPDLHEENERQRYLEDLHRAIEGGEEDRKWAQSREKWYWCCWTWSGRIAQLAFIAGLVLLLCFVIFNTLIV